MDHLDTMIDTTDEEILTFTVSDEALESSACTEGMAARASIFDVIPSSFGGCC